MFISFSEHKFQFKAYFKELNIQAKGDNEAAIISGIKTEDIIIIPDSSKKALSEGMRIHQ